MSYKVLSNQKFAFQSYSLEPIRYQDIFLIKDWRNKQIDILRQKELLTNEDQERYYQEVILNLFHITEPQQILFSFLKDNKCIGYGGLVHISWQDSRGEVSFLLDPERVTKSNIYEKEFGTYLELIKKVAFQELSFKRIFTETFDIRDFHISVLEKNDFVFEGRLRKHIKYQDRFIDSLIHGNLIEDYDKNGFTK